MRSVRSVRSAPGRGLCSGHSRSLAPTRPEQPRRPAAGAADAAAFDGALLSWDDNEWLGPDPAPSYSGGCDTPTCPKCHELVWVQFGGSCGCRSV